MAGAFRAETPPAEPAPAAPTADDEDDARLVARAKTDPTSASDRRISASPKPD